MGEVVQFPKTEESKTSGARSFSKEDYEGMKKTDPVTKGIVHQGFVT